METSSKTASSESDAALGVDAISKLLESQHGNEPGTSKKVELLFRDLTVKASASSTAQSVKTLPEAIFNTFGPDQVRFVRDWVFPKSSKSKEGQRSLLSGFSGVVKSGEMLFVLGRPGSGCSTFLRTAANRTNLNVSGGLYYGGIPAPEFTKRHRRETIYLPEEDRHIASLTVAETIRFSLRLSIRRDIRSVALIESLVKTVSEMFGLGHVLDSPVGGAFFPGVSGGERKRVSIAEALAAGSSVQCFDNSTRGLDSTTALDFVKALRILTDMGHKTTLATLYQAGEDIYNHFDKVLVIDDGHEVFFGKTTEARAYFENLGFEPIEGQTTAEFLAAVTDPVDRQCRPGSVAAAVRSSADLAAAFKTSAHYAELQTELNDAQQNQVVLDRTKLDSSHNLSFPGQVWECLRREFQLVKNQRQTYYIKWITTIILCLSCGSLYWNISNSAKGAFTRGGILFFALILNGWLQFPELFDTHTNRPVIERQSQLVLYRPSAVALARFLIDIPLIAFQHVLFVLSFYFLTRLQLDASKFFFFYLTLFVSTINFSNLLRMFAYFVTTLDDCFRYGGFSCTVLLLFAGFLIPAKDMKPYFGWIHYINPMYYGFENLFVNEFQGLSIDCRDGKNLIPQVSGSSSNENVICTIPGARPGQVSVSGSDYAAAYGFQWSHRWRNIGIMLGIAIVYLVVGALGSESMRFAQSSGNPTKFVKAKNIFRRRSLDDADVEKQPKKPTSDNASLSPTRPLSHAQEAVLTWRDVTVKLENKTILKGVSGYARRGELTAICGASGAGKTTLLNALSYTTVAGSVEGEIAYNAGSSEGMARKNIGFAQQMDLHDGTATVREALEFSALLRQPKHFSKAEKLSYVAEVIEMLDLRGIENAILGDSDAGLGVEQLKRVTVGVELAARPEILFADEPTSGLDTQGAAHLVHYLQLLARHGQAVIATIHQPSAALFHRFDNLLVLSEGETVYFGDVHGSVPYFEFNGASPRPGSNPAEFILETTGSASLDQDGKRSRPWSEKWSTSTESKALITEIRGKEETVISEKQPDTSDPGEFNASTTLQTWHLTKRLLKNQWRNSPYVYSKIWVHTISAILIGLTFYQLGSSPQDLQNRAFSVYFIVFLCNAIVNVILARFFFARLFWEFREGPSRTYNWVSLCSASIVAEIPAAVLVTVIYFVLWYYLSGLPSHSAGYMFLFLLTYEIFQVLLGLFMMALSPSLGFAGNVLVFIVCTCNWFNGIIVPYDQMQIFWRYWLYYLNPFTYLLGGMIVAVTSGIEVHCSADDITRFNPPDSQTCAQYAGAWAASANARLINPTATTACEVCKWVNGDQYLAEFNLRPEDKWPYWAIFVLFTLTNVGLVYFFTWATKIKRWKLFYFF
ncbi:MAG: hypothetical protein M1833_001210 [Piccolia ochrophora]|nr:MAG: hypothetical protein M1833_001210 [Piccolia ochrophora]